MCVPHSDTTRAFHWTESQFHFFTAASEASHYLAPVSLFSFTGLLPALLTLATSTGLLFLLLTRGQAALPGCAEGERVSGEHSLPQCSQSLCPWGPVTCPPWLPSRMEPSHSIPLIS